MPSPFPGMDPFLEGPLWTSFHAQCCVEIARQLTPKLLPKYAALTEKRFIATTVNESGQPTEARSIFPDAAVTMESTNAPPAGTLLKAPLYLPTVIPEKVPQTSVEIIEVDGRKLVTAIELLSPANKRGDGRGEYLQKRNDLLLSEHHLVEIDLLRGGQRVPMRKPLPSVPYFAFVSRAEKRPITEVWPIPLRSRLPSIPIPLLTGDPDVALDLQAALDGTYDAFGYATLMRYDRRLDPPLGVEDQGWVVQQLRAPDRA